VLGRASGTALELERGLRTLRIGLPDPWLSSRHAVLQHEHQLWVLYDRGSKNGCFVRGAPVDSAALAQDDVIELGSSFMIFQSARDERSLAALEAAPAAERATLHEALHQTWIGLERAACSELPILIRGETGTGKEVTARRIHRASGRPGRFCAINCGAIAASVAESELFGYKRGAFSGASSDRPGLIRAAEGGTLFLDEVGDLSPELQVKLLRVLQEREVLPVGDTEPKRVDLRVIAASHRSLHELVERGQFREDLLARLGGYVVELPPLRERVVDIGILLRELAWKKLGSDASRLSFEREALRALYAHHWPHNVRELERALEVGLALRDGDEIGLRHLPRSLVAPAARSGALSGNDAAATPTAAIAAGVSPASLASDDDLRTLMTRLLIAHSGNISEVARQLGKDRVQIRRWCRRLQLDVRAHRDLER